MSDTSYYSRRERRFDVARENHREEYVGSNGREEYGNNNNKFKVLFIVFLILSILLSGHLVWCLVNHVYSPEKVQVCSVCELPENECTCRATEEELSNHVIELEAQVEELSQNCIADENGCLHCPIHCPDECEHSNTYVEESDWKWTPIGKKDICRVGVRTVTIICSDCDSVIEVRKENKIDSDHEFGDDDTCIKCGYSDADEPTEKPDSPTPKPTSKPHRTSKPDPTPKPTSKPDRTSKPDSTPKPTSKPDVTSKPTSKPTECAHEKTTRKSSTKWTSIGTESTCGKNVTTTIVVCDKCGKELSNDVSTETVHNHTFEGRTCTKCGYKRPLAEGRGEAEGTVPPPHNSWEISDDGEIPNPVPD